MRRITVFDPKRNFCAIACCFDIATNCVAQASRIQPSCVGLHMNEKQVSEKTTLVKRQQKSRLPSKSELECPKTTLHSVDDAECAAPNPRIALSRSYANSVSWSAAWLFKRKMCRQRASDRRAAHLALLLCDSALSGSLRKLPGKNKSTAPATQTCTPLLAQCFLRVGAQICCRSPNEIHHIRVAHWPPHARHMFAAIINKHGVPSLSQTEGLSLEIKRISQFPCKVCTLQCNHSRTSGFRPTLATSGTWGPVLRGGTLPNERGRLGREHTWRRLVASLSAPDACKATCRSSRTYLGPLARRIRASP